MNYSIKDFNLKSEFIKNIFTLLSGSTIAQVITLLAIPVLTRIFTPQDFGFFAVYFSLATIVSTIATGRYELAIMLPKYKKDALSIVKGSLIIVFITSIICLIAIIILKSSSSKLIQFIEPGYFYFLPLSVLLMGFIKVYSQWFSRQKEFKIIAISGIAQSGSTAGLNIFSGLYFYLQSTGLFIGHIVGQFFQFVIFFFTFKRREKTDLKEISTTDIKTQLKENINFPYYSAPMGFLNSISVDILIYMLTIFYSTTIVGLYTNATKVVNYPLNLISQSFTSVFYQKISETEKKVELYLLSFFINLGLATIAMIPIVFWGEELFAFVLGNDWTIAGSIARYLAPLTITSFAMRNVSNIFSLTRRNGVLLIWQIIYLIVILSVVFISKTEKFEFLLIAVSIAGSLLYLALAFIGYRIMKREYEKTT
jgi:O-antigen/teichoic acid export membrane protein